MILLAWPAEPRLETSDQICFNISVIFNLQAINFWVESRFKNQHRLLYD